MKKLHTIVIDQRSVVMQRIMDAVSQGYFNYTCGEISIGKAEHLDRKFDRAYRIHEGRLDRIKSKNSGFGNARLLMFYRGPGQPVLWWLLVTAGEHPAYRLEQMQDATRQGQRPGQLPGQRIEFDGFVLVRQTKKPVDGKAAKPSWTWRFTEEKDEAWRAAIKAAIRHKRDRDLQRIMGALYASPGFNGARVQIGKIRSFLHAEWKRSRGATEALPSLPTKLGYVRRLPTTGLTFAQLAAREALPRPAKLELEAMPETRDYQAIP